MKAGETPGYPRFQGATATTSFTYKQFGNGATLDNGFLVLSKIGRIAVRWSRPIEGTPKTVTISREADGWYVCFSCADVPVQPLPATGQETGIDLGLEAFATLSDGTRIFHPGWYRKAERALKTAQRRVSRRKKGSNRRRKAVTPAGQGASEGAAPAAGLSPQDGAGAGAEPTTRSITKILQTANMVKNHHLAKSIYDAGWSAVPEHPRFQGSMRRSRVVAVTPAYTSQTCSGCGEWSGPQGLVRPLARLPGLWRQPASRPQRGQEHRTGRAGPSGRGWGTGLGEPRISRF